MAASAILLSGAASQAPSYEQTSSLKQNGPRILSAEKWREDLNFLVDKVKTAHRFPFSKITKESFEAAAAGLETRLASLSDHDIVIELAALVAMLGDGHSRLSLPIIQGEAQGRAHMATPAPAARELLLRRYPVAFYLFSDGFLSPGQPRAIPSSSEPKLFASAG